MKPNQRVAVILVVLIVAGILTAATLAGSSDAEFAVQGSLDCPPYDEPRPVAIPTQDWTPEWLGGFSERIGAWSRRYHDNAARHFIARRTSMVPAERTELRVDFFEYPSFEEKVDTARSIFVGRVVDQRLGHAHDSEVNLLSLMRTADSEVTVSQPISPYCKSHPRDKPVPITALLGYFAISPALLGGKDYVIVAGPDEAGGAVVLLAYELSGDRLTALYPTRDSPLDDGASLDDLIALLPPAIRQPCVLPELAIGCSSR